MKQVWFAAVIVSTLGGAPTLAQDAGAPKSSTPAPAATLACTNSGLHYQVGEFACIAACHGQRRLARCDAIAARASWTYVSESCPTAMINAPWPSDWSELPAAAVMSPEPVNVNRSAIPADFKLAFAVFDSAAATAQ